MRSQKGEFMMNGSRRITSQEFRLIPHLFAITALSLGGCAMGPSAPPAPSYRITPIEHSDTRLLEHATAASIKDEHSVVTIRPDFDSVNASTRPSFSIVVVNAGSAPFSFGVRNIGVRYNGEPVKVLSESELVAEVERQKAQRRNDSMMAGMLTTLSMGLTDYAGGVNIYNTQFGQSLMEMASKADSMQQEQADEMANALLAEYRDTVLKTAFISPDNRHGGSFIIEAVAPQDQGIFDITVQVGQVSHEIRFQTSRL